MPLFFYHFWNQGENNEFALMISMEEGTTEMYEYDGFQFFPTPVTFTGGSLGRGVSKMRTFKMNNEFLVLGKLITILHTTKF